jgi:hypothetical protein
MNKDGWTSLLHFEMTGIGKIENEVNKEIPDWIKITSSPNLLVILQKIQVYVQEHTLRLGYLLENEQISPITSHHNIIGIMSRKLHEKLKYCRTQTEKEHCLMNNIAAISCLKNNFYDECGKIAAQLNLQEAEYFFRMAAENEARVWKWTTESRTPVKETNKNHYLLL